MLHWALTSLILAVIFGTVYFVMGPARFAVDCLPTEGWRSFLTMLYYSVVTFTTLGFGDITPKTLPTAMVVTIEVFVGYVMLGGLISIFANKLARRS